jgi:hypothetical protein
VGSGMLTSSWRTMETILNLIWLAITAAAIWLWRFRWLVSRQNPRARVFQEVVAIGCALALLFPVISLTDDLHPEIVAVDAVSGKRNSGLLVVGAMSARHAPPMSGTQSVIAIVSAPFTHLELRIAGIVFPTADLHPPLLCGSYLGRSPPSLL